VTAGGAIAAAMRPPGTHRADDRRMARGGPISCPSLSVGRTRCSTSPRRLPRASRPPRRERLGAGRRGGRVLHGVPVELLAHLLAGCASVRAAIDRLAGYAGPLALAVNDRGEPELRAEAAAPGAPPPDPVVVLQALAAWAERQRERRSASDLRATALRALKTTGAKAARARAALSADRAQLGDPADLRRRGSALLAHLAQVPRGAAAVEVPDPCGDGPPLVIALDPVRPPAANAEAYFQAARRAERARDRLAAREQEIAANAEKIAEAAERVAAVPDQGILSLVAELAGAGLVPPDLAAARAGAGKPAPAAPAVRLPYRAYSLGGGWEIRVGRSDADNDATHHELAHPRDLWLHAHGASGSHVILRRIDGTHSVPPAAIVAKAAAAAAHFSAARHSHLVPVIVTEKRYVRRPRRSPPGTAVCLREKTVMVEPHKPAAAERETPRGAGVTPAPRRRQAPKDPDALLCAKGAAGARPRRSEVGEILRGGLDGAPPAGRFDLVMHLEDALLEEVAEIRVMGERCPGTCRPSAAWTAWRRRVAGCPGSPGCP